jgi:hypothetical protein
MWLYFGHFVTADPKNTSHLIILVFGFWEQAHQQSFAEKPCTFMARIQLEYEMQR